MDRIKWQELRDKLVFVGSSIRVVMQELKLKAPALVWNTLGNANEVIIKALEQVKDMEAELEWLEEYWNKELQKEWKAIRLLHWEYIRMRRIKNAFVKEMEELTPMLIADFLSTIPQ